MHPCSWRLTPQGWLYLEPIFGSEDIMQQMPNEGRKFRWDLPFWVVQGRIFPICALHSLCSWTCGLLTSADSVCQAAHLWPHTNLNATTDCLLANPTPHPTFAYQTPYPTCPPPRPSTRPALSTHPKVGRCHLAPHHGEASQRHW